MYYKLDRTIYHSLLKYGNSEIKNIKLKKCITWNNHVYSLLRYDKYFLCKDMIPTYGLFRSLVFNKKNKLVSFAPPKLVSFRDLEDTDGEIQWEVEEMVEGIMIQLFWDESVNLMGGWEIATRNEVGGETVICKNKKSVRTMFLEATRRWELDLNSLNHCFCYSFVLDSCNRLVLTDVYQIIHLDEELFVEIIDRDYFKDWKGIHLPKKYESSSKKDLMKRFGSMNMDKDTMGMVLRNHETGIKSKIRNPVYEYVKKARTLDPKLQLQYLFMRKENLVKEYLTFFPENKKTCAFFRDALHKFTQQLYENYRDVYIKKNIDVLIPLQYNIHMQQLHRLYLEKWKPAGEYVTPRKVIDYVNQLSLPSLLHFMNFCFT